MLCLLRSFSQGSHEVTPLLQFPGTVLSLNILMGEWKVLEEHMGQEILFRLCCTTPGFSYSHT